MKKRPMFVAVAVCASLFVSAEALAGDTARGKKLYDNNCFGCHDTSIHTRSDRIIYSRSALEKRVRFCRRNAGVNWSDRQIDDVVTYLNQTFYHFED